MKTKMLRKTIAAIMALTIIGGVTPTGFTETILSERAITAIAASGRVTLSGDTLILNGEISKQQLDTFRENENIKMIIAKPGTILPEDSSRLFYNYNNVEKIDLWNADYSKVKDMQYMFSYCNSATEIKVKSLYATNMECMFNMCRSLKTIDLSEFNTSNVTNMFYMFNECNNLITLDLSNFNTSNVKEMNGMFGYCYNLETLDLSSFDTSKVTNMSGMFANCSRLTNIDVSGFDTSNAIYMNSIFYGCSSLKSLNITNFDTSNARFMNLMFYGCSGLNNINVSSFDTSKTEEMESMFENCSNLTILDLSNFNTSKVDNMEKMFFNCHSLERILVSSKWTTNSLPKDPNYPSNLSIFQNCYNLVGGNGTTYSSSHTNKEYARIDKVTSSPGYLTASFFNLRISHDINSKNNFGISYYIPAYLLEGYSNLKLKIQEEVVNADGTTSLVDRTTLSSGTETQGYGTQYVFRYNGIPAKKIGSNFYATLIAEKDGITYTSSADIYSIKKYANAKIKKDTVSAAMKELLVDMLNYGAAAQLYTNYNTTNLANSELTVAQQDYASKFNTLTLKSDYSNKNLNGAKAQIKKPTLLIGNTVSPRYSMTFNDTVNKDKVKLRIEYTDINGTKVTKSFAFDKFTELSNNPGTYQYDFSGLDAQNAFQSVTATLYENNTKISNTVTYSIPTFAYENANNSKKSLVLRNVTKAMMVYFNTAKNYTAWNSNSGLNT